MEQAHSGLEGPSPSLHIICDLPCGPREALRTSGPSPDHMESSRLIHCPAGLIASGCPEMRKVNASNGFTLEIFLRFTYHLQMILQKKGLGLCWQVCWDSLHWLKLTCMACRQVSRVWSSRCSALPDTPHHGGRRLQHRCHTGGPPLHFCGRTKSGGRSMTACLMSWWLAYASAMDLPC